MCGCNCSCKGEPGPRGVQGVAGPMGPVGPQGIPGTSGTSPSLVSKTANYVLLSTDYTVNCTANSFNVTLPTAVGITGKIYVVKNSGALADAITLLPNGSETIDGQASIVLAQYDSYTVQSNGANWIII